MHEPSEAERGHWIPRNWRYRQLCVVQRIGMEDLNSGSLQEQQISLTTESFLLTTSNFLDQIIWSHFEMQMEFLPYGGQADDFMMF